MTGTIRDIDTLSETEQTAMEALMADNFQNVSTEHFQADLHEKEKVALLRDSENRIRGFSTILRFSVPVNGKTVMGIFSGDTIIDPACWGTMALPRTWAPLVFKWSEAAPHDRVYWFLLSASCRTYRFLPIFFDTFYPTHEEPTPPKHQKIIDALATARYGDSYDATNGIVHLDHPTPLRKQVGAPTEHNRRENPHVSFFLESNPGWTEGEQLACLTKINRSNLTRAGRRILA